MYNKILSIRYFPFGPPYSKLGTPCSKTGAPECIVNTRAFEFSQGNAFLARSVNPSARLWYIYLTTSLRIQSYNLHKFLIDKLRKSSVLFYSHLQKTRSYPRMSQLPNAGTTLTGGIQDIAAVLPLLWTDQCEKHVGSAPPQPRLFQFSGVSVLSKSAYLFSFRVSPSLNLRFLSSSVHIPNSL